MSFTKRKKRHAGLIILPCMTFRQTPYFEAVIANEGLDTLLDYVER